MKLAIIVLTCVLALTRIARAGDPDHLVPVDPHPDEWSVGYSSALQLRLKLRGYAFAQMLVMPSFEGEFAVRLHGTKDDRFLSEAGQVFVTYSVADRNIAYSLPPRLEFRVPGWRENRKKERIRVSTSSAEIPKELATRVLRLWEEMLLRTRYEEQSVVSTRDVERIIRTDGTSFEFSALNAYGETWSPQGATSPLLLVELGATLIEYSKAVVSERAGAMKHIEDKATELERYLSEHPPT
jgi:hypothetical protein